MRKIKKLIVLMICTTIISSFMPKITSAEEQIYTTNYNDDYIHTIVEDNLTTVVYCLNNTYTWPHTLVNKTQPINYLSGYDSIENHEKYDEIIKKLEKILYAGYPHNSQNLFSIVDEVEIIVTKDDINNYLNAPNELILAFNGVGIDLSAFKDGTVTLDNYKNYYSTISKFYEYVYYTMKSNDTIPYSIDGVQYNLTKEDIVSMEFSKTINSILANEANPESYYSTYYPSYFTTKYQAYDATNYAIWKLLYDYGIEGNTLNSISEYPLAQAIYDYAINSTGDILNDYTEADISLSGDFYFTKGNDGKFYSGKIKINESTAHNGAFKLSLPSGISIINAKTGANVETDNNKNASIYSNIDYILVSDDLPKDTDEFILQFNVLYGSEIRLYSPKDNITYSKKPYQKLGGLYLSSKDVSIKFNYIDVTTGNLSVTKNVVTSSDDTNFTNESFEFTVNLFDSNINGTYGDMTFDKGIAKFTLKHNEVKTASSLPVGTNYEVIESNAPGYNTTSENSTGTIIENYTKEVKFTNTKAITPSPRLSTGNLKIKKIVSGNDTDVTKSFTFTIILSDTSINGSYGDMEFINGVSTITLKHNETKTATELPIGISYEVIETNNEGYIVKSRNSSGTINSDEVVVEFENIWPQTPDTPSTDIPTKDTPNTDVPSIDTPTSNFPDTDVPSTDIPTNDTPDIDVPSTDAPTNDTPNIDVPSTNIPTVDTPDIDVPSTNVPTTDTPNTDVPSTDIPTTDTSNTDVPSTDVPSTYIPNTNIPSTNIPTSNTPNTDVPSTNIPTSNTPNTDIPSTNVPTTDTPNTDVPSTDIPTSNTPNTDVPSTDIPTSNTPNTDIPSTSDISNIALWAGLSLLSVTGVKYVRHYRKKI